MGGGERYDRVISVLLLFFCWFILISVVVLHLFVRSYVAVSKANFAENLHFVLLPYRLMSSDVGKHIRDKLKYTLNLEIYKRLKNS